MNDLTGDLLAAVMAAPAERKEAALRMLRGEAVAPAKRETEPFLALNECARRLGVSACSLWRWGVPGHSLGGRRKFRMSEIEAYLESEAFRKRAAEVREEEREKRSAPAERRRDAASGRRAVGSER